MKITSNLTREKSNEGPANLSSISNNLKGINPQKCALYFAVRASCAPVIGLFIRC